MRGKFLDPSVIWASYFKAVVLASIFVLLSCDSQSTFTVVNRNQLPPEIEIQLYDNQKKPYLVDTNDALVHLNSLVDERPFFRIDEHIEDSVFYVIDPSFRAELKSRIKGYIRAFERASAVRFEEIYFEDNADLELNLQKAHLVFWSTNLWDHPTEIESNLVYPKFVSVKGGLKKYNTNIAGCLLYEQVDEDGDVKVVSAGHISDVENGLLKQKIILVDQAYSKFTKSSRYDVRGSSIITLKCIGGRILEALEINGVPEKFPSILEKQLNRTENANFTEHDMAAVKLFYQFDVDPDEFVARF